MVPGMWRRPCFRRWGSTGGSIIAMRWTGRMRLLWEGRWRSCTRVKKTARIFGGKNITSKKMPIHVDADVRMMDEDEFKKIAYTVMNKAFTVQNEYGNCFAENLYRDEIASECVKAEF